ncbi:MAG: hypothetical protein ACRD96_28310 [Bryobacteraceae bacterium]
MNTDRRGWLLGAFLLACSLLSSYFMIFSEFVDYDDEGCFLLHVRDFNRGHTLYSEMYSQYGPSYFFFKRLLFVGDVTHNAGRLQSIAIWLLSAGLCAWTAFRLTRHRLLALIVYWLSYLNLSAFTQEPGLAQEMSMLLVCAAVVAGTFPRSSIALGVIAGVLVLAKVNMGVLVLAAAGLATLLSGGPRLLAWPAIAAGVALAPLLLSASLDDPAARRFALTTAIAVAAIVVVTLRSGERGDASWLRLAAAFALTVAALSGIAVSLGTPPAALLDGVLLQHTGFGARFFRPPPIHERAVWVAALGLVLAVALAWRPALLPPAARAFGRFACGILVIRSVLGNFLDGAISFFPAFLWVILLPRPDFPRLLLALTAVFVTLQAYPIPGTKVLLGTVLLIPFAAVAIHDGLTEVARLMPVLLARRQKMIRLLLFGVAVLLVILGAGRTVNYFRRWDAGTPAPFAGASRLRLPEEQVAALGWVVENLRAHSRCFYSLPGLASFHFWTGLDSPTRLNFSAWMYKFDERTQTRIAADLDRAGCDWIVFLAQYDRLESATPEIAALPLVRRIRENYRRAGQVGGYRLLTTRNPAPPLVYSAFDDPAEPGRIRLRLPARLHFTRLSAPAVSLTVLHQRLDAAVREVDVSVDPPKRIEGGFRAVRLLGSNDEIVATIPFVD